MISSSFVVVLLRLLWQCVKCTTWNNHSTKRKQKIWNKIEQSDCTCVSALFFSLSLTVIRRIPAHIRTHTHTLHIEAMLQRWKVQTAQRREAKTKYNGKSKFRIKMCKMYSNASCALRSEYAQLISPVPATNSTKNERVAESASAQCI